MKITTLEGLLADELKDIYSAETQMIKALPKLIEAAEAADLRLAFEDHLVETRHHVERIEQICEQLDVDPVGKKCVAMEGLVNEGKEVIRSGMEPELMDVALIGAAQRVEHYEIAAYGTARAHARQLGLINIANLLNWTLDEEKKVDQRLTELAENRINVQAAMRHGVLVM
jgi:ferritin-like metal-binding protein YciE